MRRNLKVKFHLGRSCSRHRTTEARSLTAKLKKVKKKKKRVEGDFEEDGRPYVTKVFAKFSHDAPLPVVKKKHLSIEQLNARRRKVWLTIAKKEIPKVRMQKFVRQSCDVF